jgi:hypothetical protein
MRLINTIYICSLVCIWSWVGAGIAIDQAMAKFHSHYAILVIQHADGDFVAKDLDRERSIDDQARAAKTLQSKRQ